MTLVRLHDYYDMNFIERLMSKGLKNYYWSDDLDDVYKIIDHTNNNLIFDRRFSSSPELQIYGVFLDSNIEIELNKNKEGKIHSVRSFNHPLDMSYPLVIINEAIYDRIMERSFGKCRDNVSVAVSTSSSSFYVSSSFEYPFLMGIDIEIPPRRKRRRKNLKSILDLISFPGPSLIPFPVK